MTNKIKTGKTTDGLLLKLLQDEFRPRLKETIKCLQEGDNTSMPFATLVDLTTKCDLGCSWCIDKYVLSNKEIPEKRMEELLNEFKKYGIRSVVYFGGGEPLMHNRISTILEKTNQLSIEYAINTNGILLKNEVAEIIAKTCSWIRISLDAASDEKYKELHKGKNYFQKIIKNIKSLNKIKKGTVGTSFVVMENNINEIFESAKLIKNIGCDFIQFKPMYLPSIKNKRSLSKYVENLNIKIKKELKKAKKLEDSKFAVLVTGSMNTLLSDQPVNQGKSYTYCAAQQFIPLITPHGVYVCPNLRGSKKGRIGDILNDSFKEVWESKKRKNIIENINPSVDCSLTCLRHQINVIINSAVENEKMGIDLLNLINETKGKDISDRYFI